MYINVKKENERLMALKYNDLFENLLIPIFLILILPGIIIYGYNFKYALLILPFSLGISFYVLSGAKIVNVSMNKETGECNFFTYLKFIKKHNKCLIKDIKIIKLTESEFVETDGFDHYHHQLIFITKYNKKIGIFFGGLFTFDKKIKPSMYSEIKEKANEVANFLGLKLEEEIN